MTNWRPRVIELELVGYCQHWKPNLILTGLEGRFVFLSCGTVGCAHARYNRTTASTGPR